LWDPDAVIVETADLPDTDTYRGHEGIVRWWMNWSDAFENAWIEPQDFLPHGDHVVVQMHQRFLSKLGIEVERDITHVFTLRDGKLVYATGYRDRTKPSTPWGCRSKTLTPTPEGAEYSAGDVAGERGAGSRGFARARYARP
jgi:ketosteroid isomerase-like protein